MSKISFEKKKKTIFIVNRLSYPEAVNERLFNAIASGMFEGFLPIDIIRKRKYTDLRCSITDLMPLNTYFSEGVSRNMFLDVIRQLIKLIKNCEKNMINPGNLDFQADRIFVDPHTKAVTCIYWPIVNNQNSVPAHLFLKQLPYEVGFDEHEDKGYIHEYLIFFEGINPFSINNFEKLILSLMGKQSSDTYFPSGQIGHSGESKKGIDTAQINASIEYDPFAQTSGAPEDEMKMTKLQQETEITEKEDCRKIIELDLSTNGGTTVRDTGFEETVFLGYDAPKEPTYPYLIRERTGDKVYVNKPLFRIGKARGRCDFHVPDNDAVSRNHADIITRGHQYFIIDLHSTNKTYVDGYIIPVECEIEIFSKTKIRLADEDFTFYVE